MNVTDAALRARIARLEEALGAADEVVRISDREHASWRRYKEARAAAGMEPGQATYVTLAARRGGGYGTWGDLDDTARADWAEAERAAAEWAWEEGQGAHAAWIRGGPMPVNPYRLPRPTK